jgi:transglutaminase-like putative cysteine protease/uncharacterized protein YcbK (DUF882 family)
MHSELQNKMRVGRSSKRGLWTGILILTCLQVLSLIFASSSFPIDSSTNSMYLRGEKTDESDAYKKMEKSANELLAAIGRNQDITGALSILMEAIEAFEANEEKVRQRFQEIEQKGRVSGSARIHSRYEKALSEYNAKAKEIMGHIEEVRRAEERQARPEVIKEKVKNLAEFLERNRTERKVDLKHSENRLPWRVVEPGEIRLLGDSSSIPPRGVPSAPAEPPTGNELSGTIDVQITPEIQELANSLGNHPLNIFRHVYNNYHHTPYYGSMKGSLDTYWEKEGNDYDLASLLIALFRASNVPARYVKAKIVVPIERVLKWVGFNDPMAALHYISGAKIPMGYYTRGGKISHVELEHVYLEAYIPYANYRGTGEDDTGKFWISLDPSFKGYNVSREGVDLASQMRFDWKNFADGYLGELRNITPIEYYKKKVDEYISQNYPGQSVDSLKRITEISRMQFDFLPNTLPYIVSEVLERFSEIPPGLRHRLRFAIPGALDFPISLPEVSGRRITLSFEGATAEDQAVIEEHGGIFRTPPYLIEVKPVLRINGNKVAEGSAMNAGIYVPFNIEHHQPGEVETFDHNVITGSFNAIGITTGKVRPEFLTIGQVEISEEPYVSKMLHSLVMKYQNEDGQTKQILNDTMKMKSKTYIDEALVSTRQEIDTVMGGIPMSFDLSGFMIDAKAKVMGLLAVDGNDKKKQIDFMMASGLEGSYQENRVFEDNMYWVAGLSAVKGLQVLKAMGVNVTELEPPQTYSNPNLPEKVIDDINNALNMGWKVIVPEATEGLAVIPYIKYDPNTGSAGYMIATTAGGYSGYADSDWPIVDQAVVDFLLGERFYTYWDWEIYSPEDGKTVLLGDVFDAFLRMTIKWISGETEETLVLENVFGTDIPLKIRIATGPGINENGLPSQWWSPGSYTLSFNHQRKFGFNVWGPDIDPFKNEKYLDITTDDGQTEIKAPLNITYSVQQYPEMIIGLPSMKIHRWPGEINTIPVRTISPLEIGENKTKAWDGKDDQGKIVDPGSYDIIIEALGIIEGRQKLVKSAKHNVVAYKMEVRTPCDDDEIKALPLIYQCKGSFVAKQKGTNGIRPGDNLTAKINSGGAAFNLPISWKCEDFPGDGIYSGTCDPLEGTGTTFNFKPNPLDVPEGRTAPLAYNVKATIMINEKAHEIIKKIKQDKLDELRQEYEDLPKRVSQDRKNFDQDAPAYEKLLDRVANDIERNRHDDPDANHNWHILKLHDLNRHAIETKNNYSNLNITSGYRCPRGNKAAGGEDTSNHQYGKAFDFDQNTSQENYDAYRAARRAEAAADTYLHGSNGIDYFWDRYYNGREEPGPPPQGVNYTRGHAAWN